MMLPSKCDEGLHLYVKLQMSRRDEAVVISFKIDERP